MPGGGPRDLLGAPHNSFAGPPLSPHVVFAPLSFPRGLHIHIVILKHVVFYPASSLCYKYLHVCHTWEAFSGGESPQWQVSCLTDLPTLVSWVHMTSYSTGNASKTTAVTSDDWTQNFIIRIAALATKPYVEYIVNQLFCPRTIPEHLRWLLYTKYLRYRCGEAGQTHEWSSHLSAIQLLVLLHKNMGGVP